jgi:hypothetical protein
VLAAVGDLGEPATAGRFSNCFSKIAHSILLLAAAAAAAFSAAALSAAAFSAAAFSAAAFSATALSAAAFTAAAFSTAAFSAAAFSAAAFSASLSPGGGGVQAVHLSCGASTQSVLTPPTLACHVLALTSGEAAAESRRSR